jgi:hypothetical protein
LQAGRKDEEEVGRGGGQGERETEGGGGKEISVSACTAPQNVLCSIARKCASVGTMGKASQQAPHNREPTLRTPPDLQIYPHSFRGDAHPVESLKDHPAGAGRETKRKSTWEFGLAQMIAEIEPTTRQRANSPTPCASQSCVRLPSTSHNSFPALEQRSGATALSSDTTA